MADRVRKHTKDTFRIESLNVVPRMHQGCVQVEVVFFSSENPGWFGSLGAYTKAVCVPDIAALEEYEREVEASGKPPLEVVENGDGDVIRWTRESPYKKGLLKLVHIEGRKKIDKLGDGLYHYKEYLKDCKIVWACIDQLYEMKYQIENEICIYGDFPEQAGAFRSGDPYNDFIGVLETLDRFWD